MITRRESIYPIQWQLIFLELPFLNRYINLCVSVFVNSEQKKLVRRVFSRNIDHKTC